MLSTRKIVAIGAVLAVVGSGLALAETTADHHTMGPEHMQEMMRHHHEMMGAHDGMHGPWAEPTLPGQDAFGAIQEIVRILDADPKTDWSKVNLEALRQHLVDMNEVALKSEVAHCGAQGS